jgi:hypothetical protein
MREYQKRFRGFSYRGLLLTMTFLVSVFTLLQVQPISKVQGAQIQTRSIKMSSSNPAAPALSNTYQVRFTAETTSLVKAIVVDFCSNDPTIGDATCTAPTGFDVGGATPTIVTSSVTDPTLTTTLGATGWTGAGSNLITGSQYRTLTITNSTGVTPTAGSSVIAFDMTNVTNPTTTGTFYARILTYGTTTTGYSPGSEGSYIDYGGVALSTAAVITITSKVAEQLSFCVYIGSCGTAANVLLGDSHDVLSTTAPTTAAGATYGVFYSLSTNATNGAAVYLKGNTLTSGGNTIPAAGNEFIYNTTGTDFFGLCEYNSSGSVPTVTSYYTGAGDGSGTCAANTTDDGTTASLTSIGTSPNYTTFGFNATNTATTYGDQLASIAAPGTTVNAVVIAAGVNVTQASGIYTTTLQLIATGTY